MVGCLSLIHCTIYNTINYANTLLECRILQQVRDTNFLCSVLLNKLQFHLLSVEEYSLYVQVRRVINTLFLHSMTYTLLHVTVPTYMYQREQPSYIRKIIIKKEIHRRSTSPRPRNEWANFPNDSTYISIIATLMSEQNTGSPYHLSS